MEIQKFPNTYKLKWFLLPRPIYTQDGHWFYQVGWSSGVLVEVRGNDGRKWWHMPEDYLNWKINEV